MTAEKKSFGFQFTKGLSGFMLSKFYVFFIMMIYLEACQGIDKKYSESDLNMKNPAKISLPGVTVLDSLNDSFQPQRTWIKDSSPPITLYIPRNQDESYTYFNEENQLQTVSSPILIQRPHLKNENGEPILDPEGNHFYMGDGGISHFASFTTDDGLGLDNITSSLVDQTGNLWFGTWGGGISRYDGLTFTNFTTAHGLSNNLVHCLAEDADGNIWIGTEGGGVSIYDGYSFIRNPKLKELTSGTVYGILTGKNGDIWIAAGDGGAIKFDGDNVFHYTKQDGLPSNFILKIEEDSHGYIWFATANNGASRFDGKSFLNYTAEDGLAENSIYCIKRDALGNLWFGTKGGGVSRYKESADLSDKGTFINYSTSEGLGHEDVWDIGEDIKGNLWFATGGGGISRYDGDKFTNYTNTQGLTENVVYTITTDRSGNIWAGTAGGGISLYKGAAFNNFSTDLGLAKNSVYGIIEDNEGNLWFGTDGGGVSKYDGKSFTNFNTDQGLPYPLIICAAKDKKGQLWFGTGGGGLALYKGVSDNGKNPSITTFNTKSGLPNNVIYAIKEDQYGNLWLGTDGAGLVKFDWNTQPSDQAGFTAFTTDQGLAHNTVYSILEDSKGNLWIGTGGGGVSKYDGHSFTNFSYNHGLSNNIVWSILEDRHGNIWFATQGGGISRFDGQSFSTFTKKEGLVNDTVYDLLEDDFGNIFIGTNRGFTVIPAHVAHLPFHEIKEDLEYYNTQNGYPVKDVNKGIFLDSKGNIWVGNGSDKTGLVKFNYQALSKKKKTPAINIKKISLYEKPVSWNSLLKNNKESGVMDDINPSAFITDEVRVFGRELSVEERETQRAEFAKIQFSDIRRFDNFPEKLILPYAQNQITIGFGTDELVRANLIEYRYILEGYNKSWSPIIKNNSATFGNIWEGDYVFKVIARYTGPAESEGKLWSEPAVYRFSVLPPWHRTWWAYMFYLIVLFVGIKRVHVFQKSKTIRKERERIQQKELEQAKEIEKAYQELKMTQAQLVQQEKLASLGQLTAGIAHEIKNPLNFVNNFSEVSIEMIEETLEEIEKKQEIRDESLILENLNDIKFNLVKVHEHGTRANSIVTSMLQHSRGGSGEMEPTDLNGLIKEYVNLCYHGMRAGNNPINVEIILNFDSDIHTVSLIKEDFSRVVINLCKNAFDAIRSKINLSNPDSDRGKNLSGMGVYQPKLWVRTKIGNDQIVIEIEDNGPGIADEIKDKIFQPFFTTKKGTEGTGLGLSITHDIVKAHGGELRVESEIGKGAKFIIQLPCNELTV